MSRNVISLTIHLQELFCKMLSTSCWKMQSRGTGNARPSCHVPLLLLSNSDSAPSTNWWQNSSCCSCHMEIPRKIQGKSRTASTNLPAGTSGTLVLFNLPCYRNYSPAPYVTGDGGKLHSCTAAAHLLPSLEGSGGPLCTARQLSTQHLGDGVCEAASVLWCLCFVLLRVRIIQSLY